MAKYKIEIDRETCVGDEACVNEAPETFEMDDENIAKIVDEGGNDDETVLGAAQACPVDAITVTDTETGEKVWPEE